MEQRDILVWSDGFWCFREELDETFLRDDSYLVLAFESDEWMRCSSRALWHVESTGDGH